MSAKLFRCNTYKKQGEGVPNGSLSPRLKEKFWRYVEAGAQSSNLCLVQFSFAIQNFRHDTWCSDCRGCGGTDSFASSPLCWNVPRHLTLYVFNILSTLCHNGRTPSDLESVACALLSSPRVCTPLHSQIEMS